MLAKDRRHLVDLRATRTLDDEVISPGEPTIEGASILRVLSRTHELTS
jgi:hypothetical protein